MESLRLRALSLPLVLEHRGPSFDLTQAVAVPHELRADPELRLDAKRRLELERRLGRDAFFPAQNAADLPYGHSHPLRESGLCQPASLDELLPQDLTWTLGRLRRRDANGKNHAEAVLESVR